MYDYRKNTRKSPPEKAWIASAELIAASIAVLAVGFGLTSAGTQAIGSAGTEPKDEPTGAGAIHPKTF